MVESVTTARAVPNQAIALLASRIDELLGGGPAAEEMSPLVVGAKEQVLVALGASVGANSHALLRAHIAAARELGFVARELATAIAMAEHVQQRAGEVTAKRATTMLDELDGMARPAARRAKALEEVRS